ncbi:hypothetical protein F7734_42225 [Scytonema sp. UIC 10036]|nr:hypothetical protein [Scytonema sp. UIC 10036]MUG98559.1 hypothetical protein [Scytonema sp. UIC 10036]
MRKIKLFVTVLVAFSLMLPARQKNDAVLTLRARHGFPVWSGWRQDD